MVVTSEHISNAAFALGMHALELRRAAGLSQMELATLLGIERSSVSVIECGRSNLPFDKLVLLSNSFGLSPSELLLGVAKPDPDMQGPSPAALLASRNRPTFYRAIEM